MRYTRDMDFKLWCSVGASIIFIVSLLPYLRDTLKHKTKPHLYSWLIWSILLSINTVAVYNDGGGWGVIAIGINALVCSMICLLSLKFGTKNITHFDTITVMAALGAILMWLYTNNPLLSVILITLIDFAAFLPT